MARPDTILLNGRAYSWRTVLETRRAQLDAWEAANPKQPALFALVTDSRPKAERKEPTLLALLQETPK